MFITVGDARRCPYKIQAKLIYADPPRNLGKNEGYADDKITDIQYFQFSLDWVKNAETKLAYDSYFVICLSPLIRPIYERLMQRYTSLDFVQEIIWHYDFGTYTRKRFVPSHDNILIYKQGSPEFHWQAVATRSQRLTAGDSRADQRGRCPGSVWSLPRVPGNDKSRRYIQGRGVSCQPLELATRLLLAHTQKEDIVYDPFMGTGTMAKACQLNNRNYYGLEVCPEYTKAARERLENAGWDIFKEGK